MSASDGARLEPWSVGRRPGLRVDSEALSDDLAQLAARHGSVSDALRVAVRQAAAIARGDVIVVERGPVELDLRMFARAGLSDASDAIGWAVDRAAAGLHAQWSATGRLRDLRGPAVVVSDGGDAAV